MRLFPPSRFWHEHSRIRGASLIRTMECAWWEIWYIQREDTMPFALMISGVLKWFFHHVITGVCCWVSTNLVLLGRTSTLFSQTNFMVLLIKLTEARLSFWQTFRPPVWSSMSRRYYGMVRQWLAWSFTGFGYQNTPFPFPLCRKIAPHNSVNIKSFVFTKSELENHIRLA